ncbi:MAG: hypothetical protein PHR39_01020 [Actinomycetota bacterium]|nr:hypothetical protein [Actinomycetota bacterium]
MDRSTKIGKCHLCGNVNKLSLEHVPPQKAYNASNAKLFQGDQLIAKDGLPWDFNGLKGNEHQNGIGGTTLCVECNSNTGAWYAKSYIDFVKKSYNQLIQKKPVVNSSVTIKLNDIYPIRVVKQILVMFMSINNPDFLDTDIKLRELMMTKLSKNINLNKYAVGMYVNASKLSKYIGLSALIEGKNVTLLSELTTIPFGYVFQVDSKPSDRYCDLTNILNTFEYDDKIDIELTMPIYDSNIVYPGDYRTKDQILKDIERNKNC